MAYSPPKWWTIDNILGLLILIFGAIPALVASILGYTVTIGLERVYDIDNGE